MASHTLPRLSLWQKVYASGQAGIILFEGVFRFALSSFHARKIQPWQKRILGSIVKAVRSRNLPLEYTRATIGPPTGTTVAKVCAAQGLSHEAVVFSAGAGYPDATLHFVNCANEVSGNGPIMLFLHGGGYANALLDGQLHFTIECANHAKAGLVVLEYTLAPEARYPTQLVQGVAALRHLLVRRVPNQVLLIGDSAGGNLALALLAHCISTSPYAPALELTGGAQFRGALLLSPWVSTAYSAAAYASNAATDYLSKEQTLLFDGWWQPKRNEVWANPVVKDKEFWNRIPTPRVLLTAGTFEIFYDDVLQMLEQLGGQDEDGKVKLLEFEGDYHDGLMVEAQLKLKSSAGAQLVFEWLREV
ncbi:hypothetical protein FH972_025996 [Carpinus fangiana]|uniref:Alpha/beta hydrolase fold-3 domain-containing protein n=1 Tax=Carpinus fangiana TaxID=176857 RepID=A0A5N6L2R0_9ROSI|nr:hypothetical protein FH972_025996 [Carpinus fangiana]